MFQPHAPVGFFLPLPLTACQTLVRNPKLSQRHCSDTVPETHLHNTGDRYPSKKLPAGTPFNPHPQFSTCFSSNQTHHRLTSRLSSRSVSFAPLHFSSASRTPRRSFHSVSDPFRSAAKPLHRSLVQCHDAPSNLSSRLQAESMTLQEDHRSSHKSDWSGSSSLLQPSVHRQLPTRLREPSL